RGTAEGGGTVVGILPGYERAVGNPWLDVAVPSGLGHARNVLVAAAGDALIALPGEHGTLSEIALARVLGRPVVVLGAWTQLRGVVRARTAREAAARAVALATAGPGRGSQATSRRRDAPPVGGRAVRRRRRA